jgi:predicted nuclease of predicted toxin-antitoxin system
MRFLVDECTGPAEARWLFQEGHEVFSVFQEARGMGDDDLIDKACTEGWILITNDKDFGEKVFRDQREHKGVILLRLVDERVANKIATLERLLAGYADRLAHSFVVAAETQVRFARR